MNIKFLPFTLSWVTMKHIKYEDDFTPDFIYEIAVFNNGEVIHATISRSYFIKYAADTKEQCLKFCENFNKNIEDVFPKYEPFAVTIIR